MCSLEIVVSKYTSLHTCGSHMLNYSLVPRPSHVFQHSRTMLKNMGWTGYEATQLQNASAHAVGTNYSELQSALRGHILLTARK